ncbi:DUF421 domain-containing protein [Paramicrobacterium agarici]|uniref:Uncharacterized membrane protein YcaP (DUF421 family) n=1 Tax=Paramicrobacterium agarici TaxID=630514 RepID=A0A2A9DVV9_9MICO|nr:YetF domain-containing protein [Microbacterium agarici]PFG30080.1 uncharacterized membrane protein YcaP (DUF421 family) [Microbacterium agarici]
MWAEYGLDWIDAIRVVVSCIVFYGGVLLLVRVLGQRTLASLSSFDLAAIIALGAVIGRAILGDTPTLFAGLLGLATLLVLQALTGQIRRIKGATRFVNSPAIVLMAGNDLLVDNLARTHVVSDEVYSTLRRAGVRNTSEVACVILEPTGQISVLKRGELIEPEILCGVVGADRIPLELRAAE